jgi:DNA topoisomerase I
VDLAERGGEEYRENCGRPMVMKKGRFATFIACTGHPDCRCKHVKQKSIGVPGVQ